MKKPLKNIIRTMLSETTFKEMLAQSEVGDKLKVRVDSGLIYPLEIQAKTSDYVSIKFKNNFAKISNNALQGDTLFYSLTQNGQITGSGKITDVTTITDVRGYDIVSMVNTDNKPKNQQQAKFIKETSIDIKGEIAKLKVGDKFHLETALFKDNPAEDDDELIAEDTITRLEFDVVDAPKDKFLKAKLLDIDGNDTELYKKFLNKELVFSKKGVHFSNENGISIKMIEPITKEELVIPNLVNSDVTSGGANKPDDSELKDKKDKYFSDREIYNIVSNDPVLSQMINKQPSFWDYLLGKTHAQAKDKAVNNLQRIKQHANYSGRRAKKKENRFYNGKYKGPNITTDPSFSLNNGGDYTVKILNNSNGGSRVVIFPLNQANQKRKVYTMDMPDKLKKGVNSGKIYYGDKSGNARQFIGSGEIDIR